MAKNLRFRPSARLQRFLGTELIADPNVAIIEFVKNSYDAGASHVLIQFELLGDPTRLLIADDGIGMNLASFEENWMHPGFSHKADDAPPAKMPRGTPAEKRRASREAVGEKGIGRLAAGRLGERLQVFTRERSADPWLHVDFVWSRFDDMTVPLDSVGIPYDFVTPQPTDCPPTGTVVVIHGLTQRWDQRVRGRAVRGRRTTRLGRLKQDLQYLVRPMGPTQAEFEITLESDVVLDREDMGKVTPGVAIEDAHYSYLFDFAIDKRGRPTITRTLRRNAEAATLSGQARRTGPTTVELTPSLAKAEDRPAELTAGAFQGTFLYNPPSEARRAREVEKSPVGVLLYRDGMLVEPYGLEDDDWVGVRARKAQRHGHAAITPDTFSGFVLIERRRNSKLRDMSNRLGLLETPESENFFDHVRAEFMHFEELLTREIVEPRVESSRADEAQSHAEESQRLAAIMLRSLAHTLRQPLQGLGWELVTLEALEGRDDIPADARRTLREVREAVEAHLKRVEDTVRELLTFRTPQFVSVDAARLVRDAVAQLRHLAQNRRAEIEIEIVDPFPKAEVLVPSALVTQALASLLENALEADRPPGLATHVEISGAVDNSDVVIQIRDNALGITGFAPGLELAEIASTKGRPAVGMANAEVAITAARGKLRLLSTGDSGTTFEVRLPTRVAGLKS